MSEPITTADVYKAGVLAASLSRSATGTRFQYVGAHLAADLPPVATTLPLSPDAITLTGGAVPAFFAGLLPEGRRLTSSEPT